MIGFERELLIKINRYTDVQKSSQSRHLAVVKACCTALSCRSFTRFDPQRGPVDLK